MRTISDAERRARLGVRHALAPSAAATDAVGAARAVVALHATDPATVVLSAVARGAGSVADVERALYDDRALVRVLAMRRTLFAVPRDLAPHCVAGAADTVARSERRKLLQLVEGAIAAGELPGQRSAADAITAAERRIAVLLDGSAPQTAQELAAADPLLGARVSIGAGTKYATTTSLVSRVLTVRSAEGGVVRATPRGGWTAGQFRWTTAEAWLGAPLELPTAEEAAAVLARRWLAAYGPATEDDLVWWTGWTKTRARRALAGADAGAVRLEDGRDAWVAPDDDAPVAAPEPWAALLPALDPTTMGWKHRDAFMAPHRERLFDVNGNGGATAWVDGRVVGAWAQGPDGAVRLGVLADVGAEAMARLEAAAGRLEEVLGGVRVATRARGWSPLELELRA